MGFVLVWSKEPNFASLVNCRQKKTRSRRAYGCLVISLVTSGDNVDIFICWNGTFNTAY